MAEAHNKSAAGWSIERRRTEIHRIVRIMVDRGVSDRQAKEILARRFTVGLNTVEGWLSEGGAGSRPPPDWKTLDILRYELGIVPVRELL